MKFLFKLAFILGLPSVYYSQGFYEPLQIQRIELQFSQSNWDYMMDTAKLGADGYLKAEWVKLNGQQFNEVGVKYKGNSSYDSTFLKNPIHIELNTYKPQNYQGFVDIKLGNSYADPSMIREVLSYNILKNYMDCPASNFAQVYVNGTYMGLYSNSESVNQVFCRNHFYSDKGTFIKCNPLLTPSPNVKSNLKHISTGDSSSYSNYYEMKSSYGWKNLEALCDSITNKSGNMASIIDVDRFIWMLAFNSVLVNLDSYTGAFAQNYYLYKETNERFVPVIWDLNMSFGGFPFLGNSNSSVFALSIANMQNMALNVHANDVYWPLIKAMYANPTFKRMYVAHVKTITEEFFQSGNYLTDYSNYKTLIDTAVQSDTRKFYSYAQFQNALITNYSIGTYSVPGIQTLMGARLSFLQASPDFALTAPTILSVNASQATILNGPITITAQITNAMSNSVYLAYRFKSDKLFEKTPMLDDGQHQDGTSGDGIYGATVQLSANQMYYYVYAENANAGMFSPQRAEHEFYELSIYPHPKPGEVVINEFLAENKSDVRNEFNMHADWIELYNTSNTTLSLDDYYLSDENNQRTKFSFPSTATIAPHQFLAVWADEIVQVGSQLHANFNLNKNGDEIILSNGKSLILDNLAFLEQDEDQSTGRCPDGSGLLGTLKYPSYQLSNCIVGIDESEKTGLDLLVFPNPAMNEFSIKTNNSQKSVLKISTSMGLTLVECLFDNSLQINSASWPNGIYFVTCKGTTKKLIINK